MEKILDNVKKEIKQIAEQGINANNIDVLYKLIDIEKDIHEIKEKEGGSIMRRDYMDRDYGMPRTRGRDGRYMGRDSYNRDNYGHIGYDDRIYQYIDRIMEGANEYQYGKDRYRDGGTQDRMEDGLEKLMYAVCIFIESMMDFAETPEEKEIIRHHIQKIKTM